MPLTPVTIGRRSLTDAELICLRDALRAAAEDFHKAASEWAEKQTTLETGGKLPMVAGGARGVEACRRMVARFHEQESGTRELLGLVEAGT